MNPTSETPNIFPSERPLDGEESLDPLDLFPSERPTVGRGEPIPAPAAIGRVQAIPAAGLPTMLVAVPALTAAQTGITAPVARAHPRLRAGGWLLLSFGMIALAGYAGRTLPRNQAAKPVNEPARDAPPRVLAVTDNSDHSVDQGSSLNSTQQDATTVVTPRPNPRPTPAPGTIERTPATSRAPSPPYTAASIAGPTRPGAIQPPPATPPPTVDKSLLGTVPLGGVSTAGMRTLSAAPSPLASASSAAPRAVESRPADPRPAETTPEVDPSVRDRQAIGLVLDRYRAALSQLDSQMARAVWPGVNVKALAHAFDQLESQKVEFGRCDIAVDGGRATATCSGTAVYVPKVGSKAPRTDARSWSFALQQNGDRWQIQRVESH